MKIGIEVIKEFVKIAPNKPGVYRMLGEDGKVLYVGKAKNLKNRLNNYTNLRNLSSRIVSMVSNTSNMQIVTTNTEIEALILEASLIKSLKPKYNILLTDDKSFPIITLYDWHPFPQISRSRSKNRLGGHEYGPFLSASSVNIIIEMIKKVFLIRTCSDSFFSSRKRPCLEHQIKRCSAPCVGKISEENYRKLANQAREFLSGKSIELKNHLVEEMQQASANMEYEKAAILRDRIRAITHIHSKQAIGISDIRDIDFIAVKVHGTIAALQLFCFRSGMHFGNHVFYPSNVDNNNNDEIIINFIMQFYQKNPVPEVIYVNELTLEMEEAAKAISKITGRKVVIRKAGRNYLYIISLAQKNVEGAIERRMKGTIEVKTFHKRISEIFHLPYIPEYIEVFDNSHISGTNSIGAMIVTGPNGFEKKYYRKFNIESKQPKGGGDDYAMMREMLNRRIKRIEERKILWLIDGGKAHMGIVREVLGKANINIPYICIAKGPDRNAGREEFFSEFYPNGTTLFGEDEILHYFQRVRDEAHRFAITTHRAKRGKMLTKSSIDAIPGVGKERKKILLNYFGSSIDLQNASVQDIAAVPGINKKLADNIFNHLNPQHN